MVGYAEIPTSPATVTPHGHNPALPKQQPAHRAPNATRRKIAARVTGLVVGLFAGTITLGCAGCAVTGNALPFPTWSASAGKEKARQIDLLRMLLRLSAPSACSVGHARRRGAPAPPPARHTPRWCAVACAVLAVGPPLRSGRRRAPGSGWAYAARIVPRALRLRRCRHAAAYFCLRQRGSGVPSTPSRLRRGAPGRSAPLRAAVCGQKHATTHRSSPAVHQHLSHPPTRETNNSNGKSKGPDEVGKVGLARAGA